MPEIGQNDWIDFCKNFTDDHADWLVTVEVVNGGDRRTAVADQPLHALSAECDVVDDRSRILVSTGSQPLERTLQTIDRPVGLALESSGRHAEACLRVSSRDGRTVWLRFRAPQSTRR